MGAIIHVITLITPHWPRLNTLPGVMLFMTWTSSFMTDPRLRSWADLDLQSAADKMALLYDFSLERVETIKASRHVQRN